MVKIIMHGCNGHMGQVISGLVEKDPDAEIVAGIDVADQGKNSYPVYTNMEECQVEADALIDFSSAKATDALLAYCEKRKLPVVLECRSSEICKYVSWNQYSDETASGCGKGSGNSRI